MGASIPAAAIATLLWIAAPAAHAALATYSKEGGNACAGALPVFDDALRKRPLAIVNEGTQPAYVTCAIALTERETDAWDLPQRVVVMIDNMTDAPTDVTCTMVNGTAEEVPAYYTNHRVFSSGQRAAMTWMPPADDPTEDFASSAVAVTCRLPSGVALERLSVTMDERPALTP